MSGIAWSFFGGNRLAPLSNPLFPSQACPKSGPFPPPALPGITGTTSLSATPFGPACPSRVSGWCPHHHRWGFPCCVGPPLYTASPVPGGTVGCARCCLFQRRRPSPLSDRVGSRITFFEACSVFTHVYGLPTRRVALRPSTPEASEMSLPMYTLRLLPTAATFVGWDSHPLEFRAFSRRTFESRLVGNLADAPICLGTRTGPLGRSEVVYSQPNPISVTKRLIGASAVVSIMTFRRARVKAT